MWMIRNWQQETERMRQLFPAENTGEVMTLFRSSTRQVACISAYFTLKLLFATHVRRECFKKRFGWNIYVYVNSVREINHCFNQPPLYFSIVFRWQCVCGCEKDRRWLRYFLVFTTGRGQKVKPMCNTTVSLLETNLKQYFIGDPSAQLTHYYR